MTGVRRPGPGLRRSTFLRASAAAAFGAGRVGGAVGGAGGSEGLRVVKVRDLTGPAADLALTAPRL
ncbi:hypothetical protein ACFQ7Z_32025 [Streptomyces virginiae]|uniref:hypothetical protein n=1 Tax=Streptomyces virginiae TaxID=1961 RepID=UPI0036B6DEAA